MKIANRDARQFVQRQHPFEGSNLYAQFHTQNNDDETNGPAMWYAVYSFGTHWPLFIRANGTWFENGAKHSQSTQRHHSQCHPQCPTVLLSAQWMKRLAEGGYAVIAKERVLQGEPA
jgi:hypothetical protein